MRPLHIVFSLGSSTGTLATGTWSPCNSGPKMKHGRLQLPKLASLRIIFNNTDYTDQSTLGWHMKGFTCVPTSSHQRFKHAGSVNHTRSRSLTHTFGSRSKLKYTRSSVRPTNAHGLYTSRYYSLRCQFLLRALPASIWTPNSFRHSLSEAGLVNGLYFSRAASLSISICVSSRGVVDNLSLLAFISRTLERWLVVRRVPANRPNSFDTTACSFLEGLYAGRIKARAYLLGSRA
jgi:hypothetical protein